jgi:hypothetical protein
LFSFYLLLFLISSGRPSLPTHVPVHVTAASPKLYFFLVLFLLGSPWNLLEINQGLGLSRATWKLVGWLVGLTPQLPAFQVLVCSRGRKKSQYSLPCIASRLVWDTAYLCLETERG